MAASETWYSLSLGDGITAAGPSEQIRSLFQPLFEAAGAPAQMAVFNLIDSEGRLHCEVTAFFSPACSEVARRLGARPCSQPSRTGLALLAGDERAWVVLFP